MTLHQHSETAAGAHPEVAPGSGPLLTTLGAKMLAALRITTGFVFLWAFLDKAFGLHYSTSSAKAWIHGGSPTKGFLSSVQVGPFQSWFHSIAGAGWVNWLFMLGLLGVGIALIAGVAVRIAAVSGVLMMAFMWLAEFPPAQHATGGAPSQSTNPLVDYHFLYAVALVVLAATFSGQVWGAGRVWARLPFVQRHRWAL